VASKNAVTFLFFVILTIVGCGEEPIQPGALNLSTILGGEETTGYLRADSIRHFSFPDDHGPHQSFRNEWWYFTGNLTGSGGKKFGYQVTFFRTALNPQDIKVTEGQTSAWSVDDIWMAHAAVTDIEGRKHYATQRFSRAGPGMAGAISSPVSIWLDDWQIIEESSETESDDSLTRGSFPWLIEIDAGEFSLALSVNAVKPPVLQGNQGLSQKSATVGNASYYYSYSRMQTSGTLKIKDETIKVSGNSWFDREWSTSSLDADQTGWDWFSLQFDSGEDLMYYQLRDLDGNADNYSQGSWIDARGNKTPISEQQMRLKVIRQWAPENGPSYPIDWQMDYGDHSWIIEAAVDDQYMDLAVKYWEGAVEIRDRETLKLVGRGYLEMTRISPDLN